MAIRHRTVECVYVLSRRQLPTPSPNRPIRCHGSDLKPRVDDRKVGTPYWSKPRIVPCLPIPTWKAGGRESVPKITHTPGIVVAVLT